MRASFFCKCRVGGSGVAVEPHDGGDEESRRAHRDDDRSGDDEGRGESHVLGQESRAQQSEGRRQQPETAVERHDASQHARFDPGLDHGDERGVEHAAGDARRRREEGEPEESRRRQKPRQREREPHDEIHQVDQHDAADPVGARAHDGASDERPAAPDDLDQAHFESASAEVLERHQREHHPDGHDEEPYDDGQREKPSHARNGVHGRETFAELPPQVGFARRVARRVGNPDAQQRDAGDGGSRHVQQQDVADRGEIDQQRSEGRTRDARQRGDDLVDSGDARELRCGGQQRDRRLHGGYVEGRAGRAAGQQDVDVPHPGCAEPEERRQRQRAEGDEAVGEDHRALAVPAVDVNPDERPQQRLGQHPGDGCESQPLRRQP